MAFYETVFILRQDLTSQQVEDLSKDFKKIITDGNGKLIKEENWGLRTLAYKINKNTKGHYVLMNIDAPYPAVAELERIMGFDENIIRKAIFRVEEISKEPSKLFVSVNAKDKK